MVKQMPKGRPKSYFDSYCEALLFVLKCRDKKKKKRGIYLMNEYLQNINLWSQWSHRWKKVDKKER